MVDLINKRKAMIQEKELERQAAVQAALGQVGAAPVGAPMNLAGLAATQTHVLTKPNRELYVGNLPAGTQGPQLQEFLGGAMQQLGLCGTPGNPILSTWLSSDGHYAFCEFRSVDETNAALTLTGIQMTTNQLKIGRPKNFSGPSIPFATSSGITPLLGGLPTPAVPNPILQLMMPPPSSYIMVVNLPEELGDDEVRSLVIWEGA